MSVAWHMLTVLSTFRLLRRVGDLDWRTPAEGRLLPSPAFHSDSREKRRPEKSSSESTRLGSSWACSGKEPERIVQSCQGVSHPTAVIIRAHTEENDIYRVQPLPPPPPTPQPLPPQPPIFCTRKKLKPMRCRGQ